MTRSEWWDRVWDRLGSGLLGVGQGQVGEQWQQYLAGPLEGSGGLLGCLGMLGRSWVGGNNGMRGWT